MEAAVVCAEVLLCEEEADVPDVDAEEVVCAAEEAVVCEVCADCESCEVCAAEEGCGAVEAAVLCAVVEVRDEV